VAEAGVGVKINKSFHHRVKQFANFFVYPKKNCARLQMLHNMLMQSTVINQSLN
jgi:hypothetical protein